MQEPDDREQEPDDRLPERCTRGRSRVWGGEREQVRVGLLTWTSTHSLQGEDEGAPAGVPVLLLLPGRPPEQVILQIRRYVRVTVRKGMGGGFLWLGYPSSLRLSCPRHHWRLPRTNKITTGDS